ncbi:RHS repeat-associated core domain-containing protein [Saccharopolyspora shandongensis]|uniref:RHS repeat-associated core domain-containing protein n=1 Tax=Saccharopolyspora shandongensis TaxID=418495 RepID=A0A1H2WR08_9PSEU|nr:RHS repeat-associated core domain-containing protein [Saccharopolyspora shandongensis]SDW83062.1 RHS repeat-associated core domain-containing protein [Saccharopolyspora shandongensis]
MADNPLVAQRQDSTTAVSGIGMLESVGDLQSGIDMGSWSEIALGAAGAGLEALSMVMDPVGTLVSYAVSWLMEHVKPLSDALDWLAGDPDQISAYAQTWGNVAKSVEQVAADFTNEVNNITGTWTGEAADAYKNATTKQAEQIKAAGGAANTISTVVEIVGVLVGIVRELVRDLVAECVAALITKIPRWIAEIGGTLGVGTPAVVAEAAGMIAKWVSKISDVITKLTRSLNKLQPLLKKLDEIWEGIKDALKGLRKVDGPASTKPSGVDAPSPKPDAPDATPNSPDTSPSSTSPDSTSSSPDGTSPDNPKSKSEDGNLQGKTDDPETPNRDATDRKCENDPIDVASGEMILPQTDVEIAAVLPLVLKRTHLSSYRVGLHFGPSWTSTLDQRLEVGSAGVSFVAEDGKLLFGPEPAVGSTVRFEGSRNTLTRHEDDGYTLTETASGRRLHFAPGNRVLPLTSITDRNGNRIEFDHDASGTPVEIRHTGGYRIRVESENDLITALYLREADNGEDLLLMRYEYADQRLTGVVNASGLPLKFEYDQAGRITSWTDRNAHWYRYTYDRQGRCVGTEGSGGFLTGTFEYEEDVTRLTNSLGHVTTFHLNEKRQVVREIDPLGGETLSEWDAYDRLLSRTDPLGRTVRREYDEQGNLIAVTRPDGSQFRFEYNNSNLPIITISADGAATRREYDEHGNLIKIVDPLGAVTSYTHDERGNVSTIRDPLGNVRRIETDQAGMPVKITDPIGNSRLLERDGFGRVRTATDATGSTTQFGWTVDGRPAWRTLPNGSTARWIHDGEGNVRTYVDALGQTTETEYTTFDLPIKETRPDGTQLTFGYDTELRLISVTNEQGLVWRYEYDPAGNLARELDFNGRTIMYRHDNAGQLTEITNGVGQRTLFTRDPLGNVIERRTESTIATFRFDPLGRLAEALDEDTQVTFQRDRCGRVLSETINGRTVTSTYDAAGRRVQLRTPSGLESSWRYDAKGQPVTLQTGGRSLEFEYDVAGYETSRKLGNEAVLNQAWGPNHELFAQTITGAGNRQIQHRSYHYREDGFLIRLDDQLTGNRIFELDQSGRVAVVHGAGWTERYAYDVAGNVTSASWPAADNSPDFETLGDREYSGTLVRRAGKVRYEHDAQGRVVLRQQRRLSRKPETWRYFWDPDDRLIELLTPDGSRWRYRYDALGRRVAKQRLTADGSGVIEQIDFSWDGTILVEQSHAAGTQNNAGFGGTKVTTWNYAPGTFRPVTQTERSPLRNAPRQWIEEHFYSIITDIVGSPSELVNDQGGIAWFHRTSIWGKTTDQSRTGAYTPLRFPGQYHDPETGFNYNYQRYYDPNTGRYGSTDPLGLKAGPNPHRYAWNPTRQIDPLGLQNCLFPNQMPDTLDQELALAEQLGVSPTSPGTPEFDSMINDGQIKWAVTEDGELRAIPKHVNGQEISHSVLTNGNPVQAAGEANIAGGNGGYFGLEVNNHSGHFRPSDSSLDVGRDAFRQHGIEFL